MQIEPRFVHPPAHIDAERATENDQGCPSQSPSPAQENGIDDLHQGTDRGKYGPTRVHVTSKDLTSVDSKHLVEPYFPFQGAVQKRTGEKYRRMFFVKYFFNCFDIMVPLWRRRWVVVKDTWVAHVNPKTGELRSVLLMDHLFDVSYGYDDSKTTNGIVVSNQNRKLVIRCWTKRKALYWKQFIEETARTKGKLFTTESRFDSFAPVRESVPARWFVDGSSYFEAVADAIEAAKEEVYITDWWLSPEIYLKRPIIEGEKWRLDVLLKRKAEQGVKIFVLLYKEVAMALGISSYYSKKTLTKQHPNIKVIRHPNHVANNVLYWAHHEKLVIVDQTYAFVGGIDLAYGRWDNFEHRLADVGSVPDEQSKLPAKFITSSTAGGKLPMTLLHLARATQEVSKATAVQSTKGSIGFEKLNEQIQAITDDSANVVFEEVEDPSSNEEEGVKAETPPPERRNALEATALVLSRVKQRTHRLREKFRRPSSVEGGQENGAVEHAEEPMEKVHMEDLATDTANGGPHLGPDGMPVHALKGSSKLWIGKDYVNFIVKDFCNLDAPFQDSIDRCQIPRMPWHDIAMMVEGTAARDVARHFIQRWNQHKREKLTDDPSYPYLLPRTYENVETNPPSILTTSDPVLVKAQVLRSAGSWSCGLECVDRSIQDAYLTVIDRAKHYIYVENQFFVSPGPDCLETFNRVGEALFQRIIRAHESGEVFRVYIVCPLLPGFEGQVGTQGGQAMQAIIHWNYVSMSRGPHSLVERLKAAGVEDWSNYLTFHGLRTHSELRNTPVTELIYVHSKLLIVDDQVVIIGSANINDRSMNGNRDSEVCMIVEDEEFEEGFMNGEPYQAGKYASALRKSLFREHLGVLPGTKKGKLDPSSVSVDDPISGAFFTDVWKKISQRNTEIFSEVFTVFPSDSLKTFADVEALRSRVPLVYSDPSEAKVKVQDVQGHLVDMPLEFLSGENLTPAAMTKEGLLPTCIWT
ncbi:unnamed protein product [Cyprideis torosa]|uniref:Phospholipase n=1 Tax=Cyprideis torosa TaxID=163714 RepID=A0A7R8W4N7_9CRUS|nr:unnamed protein product [Cyprideis torosa]CAG0879735.1 unnamed protein product [Cyprideis torosa]